MKEKILLVEDDPTIASGLIYALEKEGYMPVHCKDIKTANNRLESEQFRLAILDMQLPDGTGDSLQAKIKDTDTHVIFLTVVDDENEIVKSFEAGAADYIVKPFRLRELLARIKRTVGNEQERENSHILSIGKVTIDTAARKVVTEKEQVELTALEYRLLLIFAENRSILLTRTQILEKIWDSSGNFVEDNTLTVYIKRLREKLGDAVQIETVRGMGYRVD